MHEECVIGTAGNDSDPDDSKLQQEDIISTSNTPNTLTATSSVVVEKLLRLVAIILHYVVLLYLPAHVIRLLYTHQ